MGHSLAARYQHVATWKDSCGKNGLDCAIRRNGAAFRDLLGIEMSSKKTAKDEKASELDVVALLTDVPERGLARGQVGTVVEELDDKTLLVEFSDDQGRAYALEPCARIALLVLHYVPEAA